MFFDNSETALDMDVSLLSGGLKATTDNMLGRFVSTAETLSTIGTTPTTPGSSQFSSQDTLPRIGSFLLEEEILKKPLMSRSNIWSTTYRSTNESLLPPSLLQNEENKTHHGGNSYSFQNIRGIQCEVSEASRFFVIKSYSMDDVNASIMNGIWTSTKIGNKRLDKAFQETRKTGGKVFLFFLVNCSGRFCGVVEMKDQVDFNGTSDIWAEKTRWKGIFPVDWHIIKPVANKQFHHLRNPYNENKPVSNSRDTQEIPYETGLAMLRVINCSQ